jgi:hypothetical protein
VLAPGENKDGSLGVVYSYSKLGMDVGNHWDREAADRTEENSLKVAGCLGKVARAALMVGVH